SSCAATCSTAPITMPVKKCFHLSGDIFLSMVKCNKNLLRQHRSGHFIRHPGNGVQEGYQRLLFTSCKPQRLHERVCSREQQEERLIFRIGNQSNLIMFLQFVKHHQNYKSLRKDYYPTK